MISRSFASTGLPRWGLATKRHPMGTTSVRSATTQAQALDQTALLQRVNAERVMLLSWGRAILLQLAHPLVAAGVDDHSRFHHDRYGGLTRLNRTVEAMRALTFETPDAPKAARRINAIHDRVHGDLREATPVFPAGTPYSAHDPALLRWVHATLLDSALLIYQQIIGPLSPAEEDAYCAGAQRMEAVLGAPEGFFPASRAELDTYMQRMFASGEITVTETARQLGRLVLWPDAPAPIRAASVITRLVTIGTLPEPVRAGYQLTWRARDERALRLLTKTIRHSIRLVPPVLRYWPEARR